MTAREQGWDQADFSCGRCPHRFTATTEAEYLLRLQLHRAAHDLVAIVMGSDNDDAAAERIASRVIELQDQLALLDLGASA